jgi:hypothetical protein
MSSLTAKDNQIRKKKRAIQERRDRVHKLEIKLAQLAEEYRERTENYERLSERVKHANDEIRRKDEEIEDLKEQIQIKQEGVFNEDGDDFGETNPSMFVHDSGEKMSAEEMVEKSMEILMAQMNGLKQKVKGKDDLGDAMGGNGEESQINVSVFYQRIGEYCSFRVTPEYTFGQLNHDACKYWEISEDDGTLRDHLNLMWPPQASIMEELAKYDEPPKIILISRVRPESGNGETFSRQVKRSKSSAFDYDGLDGSDSDSDDSTSSEVNAKSLIKEWRNASGAKLSPFFHSPKLVAERNFRALNDSGSDEDKEVAEYMSIWVRLIIYCFFLYFFISAVQRRRRVPVTNDVIHSLKELMTSEPFLGSSDGDRYYTFDEIHEIDHVWQWLEKPFLNAIYPHMHYTSQSLNSEQKRFVLRANKLIGSVRVRQYRSGKLKATGGCSDTLESLKEVATVQSHGCYVPYSMDRQRVYVASLGGDEAYGPGKLYEGFRYKPGSAFNSFSVFSGSSFYDRSSFAVELPSMREKAKLELWRLRDQIWLDDSTRALYINFNLMNTNYYSVSSVKILFEFTPAGYIKKTINVDTLWLSLYGEAGIQSPDDASFLKWADIMCFVYLVKIAYDMMCELALYGFNEYFSCVWNVVDLILIFGLTLQLLMQVFYDLVVSREIDLSLPHYVQIERQVEYFSHGINLSVFNAILAALGSFKILQKNLSISKVWQTLDASGNVFLSFLFILIVVGYAFVVVAHFSFGPDVAEFNTLTGSTNALLVMLMGDFDYGNVKVADPFMTIFFYTSFNLTLNFFMASLLFAVLNDAYAISNDNFNDSESHFWKKLLSAPFIVVRRYLKKDDNSGSGQVAKKKNKGGKNDGKK